MKYRIIEVALGFQPQILHPGQIEWSDLWKTNGPFLTIEHAKSEIERYKKQTQSKEVKVVWEDVPERVTNPDK